MAEAGYKSLISYKLSQIIFDLTWEFVPLYFPLYEDARQRDQLKQAARSYKQNIVEGSSERSLSTKLKLYDVAKSSAMELLEDCEDILRRSKLLLWDRNDRRLFRLRQILENPYNSSNPSVSSVLGTQGIRWNGGIKKEEVEIIVNYLIDLLKRGGYLLDRQINAVEEKHTQEGGYSENLLRKRLEYRKKF